MNQTPTQAVIVAYGRTPCAKARKGSFANQHPIDFAAQALRGVLDKVPQLSHDQIDDIVVGCAMTNGVQGGNIARLIATRAGLPDSVSALTINRYCSSGLQAMATAANAIRAGEEEIVVAGGVESMSLVPMDLGASSGEPWLLEHHPEAYMNMGLTAENVAERWNISRSDMDQMAVDSHKKACKAWEEGRFDSQIIPVTSVDADGNSFTVTRDEGMRADSSVEGLSQMKPCFKEDGVMTAAISSQMTDGSAFVVMMSEEKAKEMGVRPLARFVGFSVAGVAADVMGIGPIEAVPKVLAKTGLSLADMDVIEINEAFASQALACIRELGMDVEKVNPWGGAMALGHPLGATGTILSCKALAYLEQTKGRYALITMCIGGGMGAAGVLELL